MNKNAFTLIEMIAAIAILGVLALLLVPMILDIRNNVLEKDYKTVRNRILDAGKDYVYDNLHDNTLISSGTSCDPSTSGVTVNSLIEKNYITPDNEDKKIIKNPTDGESLNNNKICFYYEGTNVKTRKLVACIKVNGRSDKECE